jgi:hypothetical protein
MEIVKHLEYAKAQILAEEKKEIELIKQKVTREIAPKYQELEAIKTEAINKISMEYSKSREALTNNFNAQMTALQNKFESDKKAFIDNTENKKVEIFNVTLNTETYPITSKYDKEIAKLDAQIKALKE